MARPRVVDRKKLLDIAEKCVAENGPASLSFGALAKAAGLSKATVQTVFVTRDNLLEALLGRWITREESSFNDRLAGQQSPEARLHVHLQNTAQETLEAGRTVSTMLAALAGNGNTSTAMRQWYASRLGNLEAEDAVSRRYRIAYLAAEGAFLIRNLIGLEIDNARWDEIFRDLEKLAVGRPDA